MGYPLLTLPFPRGSTMSEGQETPTSTYHSELVGREYVVKDTVHSTETMVTLRVVRAEAAITLARKFYKCGTTAGDFRNTIAAVNDSAGGYAMALDDALAVGHSIPQYDLVYAIVNGPAYLKTEASSVNIAQYGGVVSDASGFVDGAAPAAGNVVLGRADEAMTTTNTTVTIWIDDSFVGGEGA